MRVFRLISCSALVLAAAGPGAGCDRSTPAAPQPAAAAESARVLPRYSIPAELRAQHPGPVAFIEEFLEVCLANDYAGYRRLVSRRIEPESRSRFERIYEAIRTVAVESITPGKLAQLGEGFVVVAHVDFAEAPAPAEGGATAAAGSDAGGAGTDAAGGQRDRPRFRLRKDNKRIAILVFEEDGAWRMAPAPPELQPRSPEDDGPGGAGSQPATASQPVYPWDQDGDS